MTENWEDWEVDDFVLPVLNLPNGEQSKKLEERKLVEESDNKLTNDLFSNGQEYLVEENLQKVEKKSIGNPLHIDEKKAPKKFSGKKLENEAKQKALSKKNKEEKARSERARELYGEAEEDDKYAKYEDQFY